MALPQPHEGATALVTCSLHGRHFPDNLAADHETGVEAGGVAAVLGVELRYRCRGQGPLVLCIHETASAGTVWRHLEEALGREASVVDYDRRGWGESTAPDPYLRTTIEEQSEDAAALLQQLGAKRAVLCGAGLGAVAALDLMLRRAELVRGAVLIEPPLLAFVADATEGLSADAARIQAAVADGGPAAALDLYLGGGLPSLGAGAGRLPSQVAAVARRTPLSFFAELPAVPAWSVHPSGLGSTQVPSRIVLSASAPPLLERACEQLAERLGNTELRQIGADGLPHVAGASELADVVRELLSAEP
jgi:pimeloyl-ACP methyl ester carboxylesterase